MSNTASNYWIFILCGKRRYRITTKAYGDPNSVQKTFDEVNTSIQVDGTTYSVLDDVVAVKVKHGEFTLPDKYVNVYVDPDTIWDWFDESSPLSEDEVDSLIDNRECTIESIRETASELNSVQEKYDGLLFALEDGGWN